MLIYIDSHVQVDFSVMSLVEQSCSGENEDGTLENSNQICCEVAVFSSKACFSEPLNSSFSPVHMGLSCGDNCYSNNQCNISIPCKEVVILLTWMAVLYIIAILFYDFNTWFFPSPYSHNNFANLGVRL